LFEFENVFDLDSNLGFKFKYVEKKIAKPLFIFTRPKSSSLKHPWQPSQIFRFSFHSFNEPTHRLAPAQPASLAQLDAVAHLTHSHPSSPTSRWSILHRHFSDHCHAECRLPFLSRHRPSVSPPLGVKSLLGTVETIAPLKLQRSRRLLSLGL
jgi:hypothetical protein